MKEYLSDNENTQVSAPWESLYTVEFAHSIGVVKFPEEPEARAQLVNRILREKYHPMYEGIRELVLPLLNEAPIHWEKVYETFRTVVVESNFFATVGFIVSEVAGALEAIGALNQTGILLSSLAKSQNPSDLSVQKVRNALDNALLPFELHSLRIQKEYKEGILGTSPIDLISASMQVSKLFGTNRAHFEIIKESFIKNLDGLMASITNPQEGIATVYELYGSQAARDLLQNLFKKIGLDTRWPFYCVLLHSGTDFFCQLSFLDRKLRDSEDLETIRKAIYHLKAFERQTHLTFK